MTSKSGKSFRDVHHDSQLLHDLTIINEHAVREHGPLPTGGLPAEAKRKPKLSKPAASTKNNAIMTTPNDTAPLSNGLPPPPIPQRLREMLKDYPGCLADLQEGLNSVVDGPRRAKGLPYDVFEVATWRLESRLEAFTREAEHELEAVQGSGDADAIARAETKASLMRRARSSNAGMRNLEELWNYLEMHREVLK